MDKVKAMFAALERWTERVALRRAKSDSRPSVAESPAREAVVLSGRDSRFVASLLENPPALTKGLKKAIDVKYG
jgi:uncharacterized protein (DUF1778 family)